MAGALSPSGFQSPKGSGRFDQRVFCLVFLRAAEHERSQPLLTEIINTNSSVPSGQGIVKRQGIILLV